MFVILAGNPVDGMTVYGPFDDAEDANDYAENNFDGDWWVTKVEKPRRR